MRIYKGFLKYRPISPPSLLAKIVEFWVLKIRHYQLSSGNKPESSLTAKWRARAKKRVD